MTGTRPFCHRQFVVFSLVLAVAGLCQPAIAQTPAPVTAPFHALGYGVQADGSSFPATLTITDVDERRWRGTLAVEHPVFGRARFAFVNTRLLEGATLFVGQSRPRDGVVATVEGRSGTITMLDQDCHEVALYNVLHVRWTRQGQVVAATRIYMATAPGGLDWLRTEGPDVTGQLSGDWNSDQNDRVGLIAGQLRNVPGTSTTTGSVTFTDPVRGIVIEFTSAGVISPANACRSAGFTTIGVSPNGIIAILIGLTAPTDDPDRLQQSGIYRLIRDGVALDAGSFALAVDLWEH